MRNWWRWTIGFLSNQRGDLGKILTPNKTIRRIFGISKPVAKGIGGVLGGIATAGLGAIPGIGIPLAAGVGALGGFRKGGVGGALLGGLGGFGLGSLGKAAGSGISALLSPTATAGAGTGAFSVLGAGGGPATGLSAFTGGFGTSLGQTGSQLLGVGRNLFGGGGGPAGAAVGAAQAGGGNIVQRVLGGRGAQLLGGALLGSTLLRGQPQFKTDFPQRARGILAEQPNLQLATDEIKKLALSNPGDLLGPASDKFIDASLRQTRQAHQDARKDLVDRAARQGRTERTSGSLRKRLQEIDQAQLQRETDFITKTQDARRVAAIGIKVKMVADFFNIANQEAANLLAVEDFITQLDAQQFLQEQADFEGSQALLANVGGRLLFPS
ncbi:hypothetical protein LCGC14_2009190 [marine sediment metagenome]|uniref:Uncharacterized protein n=1 Tax=marine sediment metagenome TaxID=412755 RepID=A0A0F9F0Z0_9ZZZZ